MRGGLAKWCARGAAFVEPASWRDARRVAQFHGESFHRGWGEGEFEEKLAQCSPGDRYLIEQRMMARRNELRQVRST